MFVCTVYNTSYNKDKIEILNTLFIPRKEQEHVK